MTSVDAVTEEPAPTAGSQPNSHNSAALLTMLTYPLFKLLSSEPSVAAEIVRTFDFARLDANLPRIDAPPASAQVVLSAVVTALDLMAQQRFPEALRCALIAGRSVVELCDAGRHAETVLALEACSEVVRSRIGGLHLNSLLGTLVGAVRYAETGELPMFAHTDRVTISAQTGGRYSELLHALIRIHRPLDPPAQPAGLLGMEDVSALGRAIDRLNADGYHLFDRGLPDSTIDALLEYAFNAPAVAVPPEAGEGGNGRVDLTNAAADGYQLDPQATLDSPAVQAVIVDPSFLVVAGQYLGCTPVLATVVMRWSLPSHRSPNQSLAQSFHWDDDWVRWLKFFFYLTDVDATAGPHVYIKGTHKPGAKPRELLARGYARIPDEDIAPFHPDETIVTIEAARGTIFAADTRCWHKGLHPTEKHRLILEFAFANSFAMGAPPSEQLVIRRSHTLAFRRFVAANRAVFPAPYFVVEDGALEGLG